MRASVTGLLILCLLATANAAEPPAGFEVLEVRQTGGFAGVDIGYRITSEGEFVRRSAQGNVEGRLEPEQLAKLSKAVTAINWNALPAKLRDPNVADDFVYQMHFVVDGKTHRVTADGVSASQNPQLKPILETLVEIQRLPANRKPEPGGEETVERSLYSGFRRDRELLRKQVVYEGAAAGKSTKASSAEACQAARRVFSRVSFLFRTRNEVLEILGDPASISDYNDPLPDDASRPLVYVFDSGYGGLRYTLRFGQLDQLRVIAVQVDGVN